MSSQIKKQGDLRIDHVVTSGIFALDGGEWEVDNNIWVIGDDSECVIVDAAHNAEPIIDAVGGRKVLGILCSHGHNDHITVAPQLREQLDAPIFLHPGDQMLWEQTWKDVDHQELKHGDRFKVAGTELVTINTPGHSPGSCCFYAPEAAELFSGDTLFSGGPGATGRSYSDFDTIIDSIRDNLLTLPEETIVRTGHGDHTTIGREAPHLEEWIKRGY
ncbi:MBL fold metallo-hydrolase [Corynebacterium spheniscorum]|uniref:Glyoxylase, beta-lactamase superfamily II n=1 Tax=Corynebacterium spheniscorum TaxID=185761 RepID=A0A1I2QPG4_9CORY|nr:MBL fold metallo-hydrolase [Corynebacterium spheniscorum]KAA8719423.1 MBL fold metallo-hydrolase [Corynebacterium spheniscorum]SFG29910.1 Glyoxylase, beta-lactamase superfamily II [Corynebacterium spheniscorum]